MTHTDVYPSFDYGTAKPLIVKETAHWAVLYKPAQLPTAPLRKDEKNNLVHWFLNRYPFAAQVRGRKEIEAGVLHRLDTATRGIVLFAKDQHTYDFFSTAQKNGSIIKTYHAFIQSDSRSAAKQAAQRVPYRIVSQFRNFGPGAKKAAPVFPSSRHYKTNGALYATLLEDILFSCALIRVRCTLVRGYRHQVRTHLAALNMPIAGDPLYGTASGLAAEAECLQLYASALTFPDPETPLQNICVALPPPDKMIL